MFTLFPTSNSLRTVFGSQHSCTSGTVASPGVEHQGTGGGEGQAAVHQSDIIIFRKIGLQLLWLTIIDLAYDEVWVLPYIPVHQEGQNLLIDLFTEILNNTSKLFVACIDHKTCKKYNFKILTFVHAHNLILIYIA